MSMIDTYLVDLGGRLRGPRAVKADLLAEARGGLIDATEAYKDCGFDDARAERQAIVDFGDVHEVASEYQTELAVSQARRTGLLISVVLTMQPLAWKLLVSIVDHGSGSQTAYELLNRIMQWTGGLAIAGALGTVLALGVGARYFRFPRRIVRMTGIYAFAVCGVCGILGVSMTLVNPATGPLLAWSGLPSTMVLLGLPLIGIGVAGRECIATA